MPGRPVIWPRLQRRPPGGPGIAAPGPLLAGRFALAGIVGQGGVGTVYRTLDHHRVRSGSPPFEVAVKIVESGEPEAALSLRREGRCLLGLRHPHIVRAYEAGSDGHRPCLVMELLRGETLAQILRRPSCRALDLPMALSLLREIGAALAALHRAGLIHGDVKPGNVFLTRDGCAKLIDLGAARPIAAAGLGPGEVASGQAGGITPAYASPSLLDGHAPDPRDDVFALATLAYVLLTGDHPTGGSPAAEDDPAPARPPVFDDARWAVLRQGLHRDPAQRPADIGAFAAHLARPSRLDRLRPLLRPLLRPSLRAGGPAASPLPLRWRGLVLSSAPSLAAAQGPVP